MRIERNEENIEFDGTQAEFAVTSLPAKGWAIYTGIWPLPIQPIAYIPQTISMRQCRLQLVALGVYETVLTAVQTMPVTAQIEFEYGTTVLRTNPLVPAIAALLGWNDIDLDTYFTDAAGL